MKPFNLAEAKAGKPIVTRDGRKAKIVFVDACSFFEDDGDQNELCYSTGRNEFYSVNSITGRVYVYDDSYLDLFMAGEKKECTKDAKKSGCDMKS